MNDKVTILRPEQVWDFGTGGCFYVGLEATKERHKGQVVHKDGFGRRIVILESA